MRHLNALSFCAAGALSALTAIAVAAPMPAGFDPRPVAAPMPGRFDPRAVEIARRALEAVEVGWALARYDQADRVRAALNLRGGGASPVGLTANAVVDRRALRYRADVGGDAGPLTLWVDPRRATLYVPGLQQVGRRAGGALAPEASIGRSLTAELRSMRANLDRGSSALVFAGEENVGGAQTFRLEEVIQPGSMATYWIDAERYLPRRIVTDRRGRSMRIDFAYGRSARPTRIDVLLPGARPVQATLTPSYDGTGRVSRLHIESRAAGTAYTADLVVDWAPSVGPSFFQPSVAPAAQEVPFDQLAAGVLLSAAGRLGGLAAALMGATGLGSR